MAAIKGTYSPKLIELTEWSKINTVNKMLDRGDSPAQVTKYINKQGFKISAPLVYQYNKMRKQAVVEGTQVEQMINPIRKPVIKPVSEAEKQTEKYKEQTGKLKNEIQALDRIINKGYETLLTLDDRPIPPKLMMDAIKLKNEITDGSHQHLTEYGISHLREVEQGKFQAVLTALLTFVPEEVREQAIDAIDKAEDEYYRGTDYYEDYLKAKEQANESDDSDEIEETTEE